VKVIDDFTLSCPDEALSSESLWHDRIQSNLGYRGSNTGYTIKGYRIDNQFQLGDEYVILTNWDCPYEESTEIALLDRTFKPLATRTIGVMYSTFILQGVEIADSGTLLLDYGEGVCYRLTVRDRSGWRSLFSHWRLSVKPLHTS